jgi:hypothetical protein
VGQSLPSETDRGQTVDLMNKLLSGLRPGVSASAGIGENVIHNPTMRSDESATQPSRSTHQLQSGEAPEQVYREPQRIEQRANSVRAMFDRLANLRPSESAAPERQQRQGPNAQLQSLRSEPMSSRNASATAQQTDKYETFRNAPERAYQKYRAPGKSAEVDIRKGHNNQGFTTLKSKESRGNEQNERAKMTLRENLRNSLSRPKSVNRTGLDEIASTLFSDGANSGPRAPSKRTATNYGAESKLNSQLQLGTAARDSLRGQSEFMPSDDGSSRWEKKHGMMSAPTSRQMTMSQYL